MKKSNIILAAIAVMTIVGGTLAFKAQKGAVIYTTTKSLDPGVNPIEATLTTTTTAGQTFATEVFGAPAPLTKTIFKS